MKLQYYLLVVAYKGQHFHGSQIQNSQQPTRTVEQVLFDALAASKLSENPQKANFKRVSRTDSGVSACQAAFSLFLKMSDQNLQIFKSLLPNDIRFLSLQRVCKSFDPLKYCTGRNYAYYIPSYLLLSTLPSIDDPTLQQQADFNRLSPLDRLNMLQEILETSLSFFNFAPFSSLPNAKNTREFIRKITHFRVTQSGNFYKISISGQGFFKHHIRRLIFGIILVSNFKISIYTFQSLFDWRVGRQEIQRVPGQFLVLERQEFVGCDKHVNFGHLQLDVVKDTIFEEGKQFIGEFWLDNEWKCPELEHFNVQIDYGYFYELARRSKLLEENIGTI
ncbi:tRNA pseudouridine synthase [Spironucleus salmonicida]|uniref:tRNA pseudouridine synthase n=1 Tax=Spironucleus salmonicida TaxID=348837 RepID=V6LM01_9EUKA|nr:tRNA pseudouridine synthase [Spironucleus salmonicida]|eukprot:EST45670.1 Pseudouridylate synthase [Spironucleus salmonicida]